MTRTFVLTTWLLLTAPLLAENWPQFRGSTRQGATASQKLPMTWSATEGVKWKSALPGQGHSSPIVWGDQIFLTATTDEGKKCHVLCVSATDGKVLWNTMVFEQKTLRKENRNSYATPTPATDGQRVYAVFGSGSIAAVDFTGKLAWTFTELEFYSRHGLGASPLLEDGLLVLPWDSSTDPDKEGADKEKVGWQVPWDRSFVLCLKAATGKQAWKTGRGTSRIAHITPNLWTDATGRKQVVSGAGDVLQGYDLKTGERLWSSCNPGEGVTPSVLIAGDIAVQTNGWGGADSVRAFKLTGASGEMGEKNMVWEQGKNAPKLPSLIYATPNVIAITEGGMAWCAHAVTGDLKWRERIGGTFASSPILAGDKIYITGDQGETVILAASEKFAVLGKNTLGEPVQASPAVWEDHFILRGEKHLYCLGE